METKLQKRSNEEWVAALQDDGPESVAAMEELRHYLRRMLQKMLGRRGVTPDDLADYTQETLLRLVSYLHTFRGESAFTTWATSVAARVAFTEIRRKRAREKGQEAFDVARRHATEDGASVGAPSPEETLSRDHLLSALYESIDSRLTERQRVALLAELRGIPTVEIAAQLSTNQNALYKLIHDARKKLRAALIARGFTSEFIHDASASRPNR